MAINPMYQNDKEITMTVIPSPDDPVNHPNHYTSHASGIEVIEITEHMNFCLGNVLKYVLRADYKGKKLEDLKKAAWYLDREIQREENMQRDKL